MTHIDIQEAMTDIALDAPAPPGDLVARVETAYRRRRRARVLTTSGLAVVLLAAGTWANARLPQRSPAPPTAAAQPFVVPASLDNPRPIREVWPRSVVIRNVSDSLRDSAIGLLDADHLLLRGTDNRAFDAYDIRTGTRRTLVADTGYESTTKPPTPAITPRWLVWAVGNGAGGATFYRAPITGGQKQAVATVANGPKPTASIYATDDVIYWTWADGLFRVPMTGGTATAVPGFRNASLGDSPWVMVAGDSQSGGGLGFRHVVTGQLREITGDFRDLERLMCTPAFCVGTTQTNQLAVSHLDGSDRTVLPKNFSGPEATVLPAGDGGLIMGENVVFDPVTGAYATPTPNGEVQCEMDTRPDATAPGFVVKHGKSCGGPTTLDQVYVIPG